MKKIKIIRKSFVVFLIAVFTFFPIRFGSLSSNSIKAIEVPDDQKWQDYDHYIVINHDTTWSDHVVFNNPDKPVIVVDGATLTIEKGTHIELLYLYVNYGRIVAEGTQDDKIIFTKATPDFSQHPDDPFNECYSDPRGMIEFEDRSFSDGMEPSLMRYVEFDNMGDFRYINDYLCKYIINNKNHLPFINTALASESVVYNPALKMRSGRVHIENSSFKNDSYNDMEVNMENYEGDPASYLEVVNSNFSGNKQDTALISNVIKSFEEEDSVHDKSAVLLKNNWYGSATPDYLSGSERLDGDYTFDGHRQNELIADPVIVIPGIMGSAPLTSMAGQLVIDPILHTYDNLIASLEKNGYEKNKNLFDFPYEWRNSNIITAGKLKDKIEIIKNDTKISRVDIVAHSMGGLVARQYIESSEYQNDVDQLVTLGTPHKGSPEAYLRWEAGEGFEDPLDKVAKEIFLLEALHSGFTNLKDYIQSKVISVGELLPDYNYLQKNGEMKNYPTGYPENIFLKDLNSQSWVNNLSKVNFYNIIGNTGSKKTITKFRVVDSEVPGSWEHGMPENFYDNELDQGIGYGGGDETVPLSSANGITADKKKELDSVHGDLPTEAQCYVFEELTGKDGCESVSTFNRITDILTFGVFSPVDIQVVAPDGKWAGKNIKGLGTDKQISGAYYSGYDFGDGPDNEFLTIPISKDNSEDGEYKITTEGTDNGSYKIKMAKISEDESGLGVGSTAEISGIATAGIQEEKIVKVVDDKITIGEVDITPPIITGHATTQPNADGWYNQDVTIHFSATDESGIASVTSDVVLDREGENLSVTGMATDNFGNTASTIVGGINIDKTVPEIKIIAPENKIYMNNKMVEIKHSASDNLTASSDLKKEIFLDGSLINANKIDLSLAHLGAHDISVKATDKAGNKKEVKSDFQVKTGLGAIISNVDHYFDLGLITKRPTKIVLQVRLEAIGGKILLLDILESKWMPWWTRERAVENMKREINRDIETLKNQINSQKNFSENIDQKARELLIESLDKIKP